MKIRALLVDDEPLARRGLALRLTVAPDFEVVGECANGRDAIERIGALVPDVVFLDIQMPGMTGLEVVSRLQQDQLPVVVFVTAYDRYAVQAFTSHALDYLLKPVDDERFLQALKRIRGAVQDRDALGRHEQLLRLLADVSGAGELDPDALLARVADPMPRSSAFITIRTGRDVLRIPSAEIDWIDAAGDYMCLHAAGETHILRATMKQLEAELDPEVFQRIHRSAIVNLNRIRKLRPHANGEYFLTLVGGQQLKLSRTHKDKVELLLQRRSRAAT